MRTEKQLKFLFVFNDNFGKREKAKEAGNPQFVETIKASNILNIDQNDLLTLTYASENTPVFKEIDIEQEFLTTVTVRTILTKIEVPFVSVGESFVFENSLDRLELQADELCAIGISTTFIFDVHTLQTLIDNLQKAYPQIPVVLGGAGLTLNPSWFDQCSAEYGLLGDAEESLKAFIHSLSTNQSMDLVPNLLYRTAEGTVRSTPHKNIDINTALTPNWDDGNGWPELVWYESLRGCPFSCKFCSYPQQSPQWRVKSAEKMFEDWKFYAEQGVTSIVCLDSTMLTPPSRMKRFCKLLIENDISIKWQCWGHLSQLQNLELLQLMAKAGCRHVLVGAESGDDQILKNMEKYISQKKSLKGIHNLQKAGILVTTHLMAGFPGETEETLSNTFNFIQEAAPDYYSLQTFQIRDQNIPILKESAAYGLEIFYNEQGVYQGWKHDTMTKEESDDWALYYKHKLIQEAPLTVELRVTGALELEYNQTVLDPTATTQYRRTHLNALMKALERAYVHHPQTPLKNNVQKSMQAFHHYANQARLLLAEELRSARLKANEPDRLLQSLSTASFQESPKAA